MKIEFAPPMLIVWVREISSWIVFIDISFRNDWLESRGLMFNKVITENRGTAQISAYTPIVTLLWSSNVEKISSAISENSC